MIDTRDYKTCDELADAMQLEHDISELECLNKKLTELQFSFEFFKHQYEISIEAIMYKKLELQNNINKHLEKLKIESESITTKE